MIAKRKPLENQRRVGKIYTIYIISHLPVYGKRKEKFTHERYF